MLAPLDKMKYTLYCMGEGWFYAKKYDEDQTVWKAENNVFEQGIERMLNKEALQKLSNEKEANLQNTPNQPSSPNLQNANNNLNRFQQAFRLAFVLPFQAYTQAIQQNTQAMAKKLSQFTAAFLRALGVKIKTENTETETENLNKDIDSDGEKFADHFVRRSQASTGGGGL